MRYTPKRKMDIINAVKQGVIALEDVMRTHKIDDAEWQEWLTRHDRNGQRGLRVAYPKCTGLTKNKKGAQ